MNNQEFCLYDGDIRIHAKLNFPKEKKQQYPLIIIFHGFTGHMEERHITAVSNALNEVGYVSLRVELYGHGKSDGYFCDHTLDHWVSNALTVIDYAKTLDFVNGLYLCGHSQGGLLAMLVAAIKPALFKAILPLSPACSIPEGARCGNFLGTVFDPDHIPELLPLKNGRKIGRNYILAAQKTDLEKAIEQYKGPVLLIHGDADTTVPVRYSCEAAQSYHNARLVIIPGDTHCYDYHLDMAVEAVKDFAMFLLSK